MPTTSRPPTAPPRRRNSAAWVVAVALSLVGCSSPVLDAPPSGQVAVAGALAEGATTPVPPPYRTCCINMDAQRLAEEMARQKAAISQRTIYFGYDQYKVADADLPTIEAHARYLLRNPDATVRVAGHADERGSREYNLALGQKRAENVQRLLLLYGVAEKRTETISYGSEKPVDTGNNAESWQRNRRVELNYGQE